MFLDIWKCLILFSCGVYIFLKVFWFLEHSLVFLECFNFPGSFFGVVELFWSCGSGLGFLQVFCVFWKWFFVFWKCFSSLKYFGYSESLLGVLEIFWVFRKCF